MLAGANHYYQGLNILSLIGVEAEDLCLKKVLVLSGVHAAAAAWAPVEASLSEHSVESCLFTYTGFNTAEDIDSFAKIYSSDHYDGVIGIGGGKIMDLAKAVAAKVKSPVFTVPTIAATCAAYAPLSVIYNAEGMQTGIQFHDDEVDAVFVDLAVIAAAPARFLAAGMADAMAKACEYSSTHSSLCYGDTDTAKYCGYYLSRSADDILLHCGTQAYNDVCAGKVSAALEDAVFATIAVIGVVSGMGGYTKKPGGRFAIAHGFNEIIRGRWEKDPRKFLHGEIVAVGILAQLYVNGMSEEYISGVREFYKSIHIPTSLADLGLNLDDNELRLFQDEIIGNSAIGSTHGDSIRYAIQKVRI